MDLAVFERVAEQFAAFHAQFAPLFGKEGRRGRRMVREAVQDERRMTIGITTLQRVKGAVWQVEGDVFELHVCQRVSAFSKSGPPADLFVEGKTMDKIE